MENEEKKRGRPKKDNHKEVAKIEVKNLEYEVNACYAGLSKTKYKLLCANEEMNNVKLDMDALEKKLKFMRTVTIPTVQGKIKNMQKHYSSLEEELNKILES